MVNNHSNINELSCSLNGLTTKKKIALLGLIPLVFMVFFIYISFIIRKIIEIYLRKTRGCLDKTNYAKVAMAFWIIIVGQLLLVLFKLLNCQKIGSNKWVHFYFGDEECVWTVTSTEFIALLAVIFIGLIFIAMLLTLIGKKPEQREDPNYAFNIFCKYYKEDCYYWEFIILIRFSFE